MQLEQGISIQEFVDSIKKRNFEQEFKFLRKYTETKEHQKMWISINPFIAALNRYSNIIPYSHSIVKPDSQFDKNKFNTPRDKFYINANYIKSITNQEKAYIATQGPIPESIADFWHMVWTNNVGIIVMLCNLSDKGRPQCEQYWPDNGQQVQYGPYDIISIQSSECQKQLFQNKILIRSKGEDDQREIIQYFWTGWPDFGVPSIDCFKTLDYLAEQINIKALQNQRPVVHCSAGVGRTGTLLSICQVKQLLELYRDQQITNGKISIFSIARRLREQRPAMINTSEQYMLVYRYALWLIDILK